MRSLIVALCGISTLFAACGEPDRSIQQAKTPPWMQEMYSVEAVSIFPLIEDINIYHEIYDKHPESLDGLEIGVESIRSGKWSNDPCLRYYKCDYMYIIMKSSQAELEHDDLCPTISECFDACGDGYIIGISIPSGETLFRCYQNRVVSNP